MLQCFSPRHLSHCSASEVPNADVEFGPSFWMCFPFLPTAEIQSPSSDVGSLREGLCVSPSDWEPPCYLSLITGCFLEAEPPPHPHPPQSSGTIQLTSPQVQYGLEHCDLGEA